MRLITRLINPNSGVVHVYRCEARHFGPPDICSPHSMAMCGWSDPRAVVLDESDANVTCGHCLRVMRAEQRRRERSTIHGWARGQKTLCGRETPFVAVDIETGHVTCRLCLRVLNAIRRRIVA